jgi:hypothetical protein
MIGRGSRVLPNKSTFIVIDLGNNAARFGLWDSFINWHDIFRSPDAYLENLRSDQEIERHLEYKMPGTLKAKFANSELLEFNMKEVYEKTVKDGHRPSVALDRSIDHHVRICIENSTNFDEAMVLADLLEEDIKHRIKKFSYCISKSTDNYLRYLQDEYQKKMKSNLSRYFVKKTEEDQEKESEI